MFASVPREQNTLRGPRRDVCRRCWRASGALCYYLRDAVSARQARGSDGAAARNVTIPPLID